MRNLIEYPVTKDELLEFIDAQIAIEKAKQEEEVRCGDMTLTYFNVMRTLIVNRASTDDVEEATLA